MQRGTLSMGCCVCAGGKTVDLLSHVEFQRSYRYTGSMKQMLACMQYTTLCTWLCSTHHVASKQCFMPAQLCFCWAALKGRMMYIHKAASKLCG